jgi:polyribonucleotide nucleotidyltransferase
MYIYTYIYSFRCCLAMLDAGVPLKSSVAGVAMGLILGETEGEEPSS